MNNYCKKCRLRDRCPGHCVHYYDDNDNEISKEEYDSLLKNR